MLGKEEPRVRKWAESKAAIQGIDMTDPYSNIIVNRILSLCKQRGITIYQLSIMSDVSYSTLDNIVNRKTFNPKIKTLHKVAHAFSMTLAEFLDFDSLNRYSFDDEKTQRIE